MTMTLDSRAKGDGHDPYDHRVVCTIDLDPTNANMLEGPRRWNVVLRITPDGEREEVFTEAFTARSAGAVQGRTVQWIQAKLAEKRFIGGTARNVVIQAIFWNYS